MSKNICYAIVVLRYRSVAYRFTNERRRLLKLASARIVSNDVPRLAEFYRQLTGISPVGNEDYVAFQTAGGTLALSSERAVKQHKALKARAAVAGSNRSVIIEFEVTDVDQQRARLSTFVREFALEPTDQPWGNRSMLFHDPDGNLINLFAPIRRTSNRSDFPPGDDH